MAKVIYVPGAEPPANDGERRVVAYLELQLPEEFLLYPGVQVINKGRTDDIDLLILTPHALVVTEIKDIAGHLAIDHGSCYVDNNLRPQPFNVTSAKARRLKSYLQERDPRFRRLWVAPLVLLARRPASLSLVPKSLYDEVMTVEDSVAKLIDPGRILPNPPFRELGELRDLTAAALNLTRGRERDVSFGAYNSVELLDRSAEEDLWRAKHSVTGQEVEIRHIGRNPITRQAKVEDAIGEVAAFGLLSDQPWIDGPKEMLPQDDGTLALIFGARHGPTLGDAMDAGEQLFVERTILDLVSAVEAAHAVGAVHGRLSPRWIEMLPEIARIRGFTIRDAIAPTELIEADAKFLAPEVFERRPVAAPADIFALGKIIQLLAPNQKAMQALANELTDPDIARRRVPAEYIKRALAAVLGVTQGEKPRDRVAFDGTGRVEAGSLIGTYVTGDFLGSGGFSQVYQARHALGGPPRTIKLFAGDEAKGLVTHEFNVLQQIDDPHVVEVIDAGSWEAGWYMISEFLDGETLTQRIDSVGDQPDVGEANLIAFELLDALATIHELGITHRDVKPDNVILVEGRGAVLFDFGVAATREEQIGGLTWQYWPPEVEPGSLDPDPDIFATGVILCELLTGQHPYPSRNPHAGGDPDVSKVPAPLREILLRAVNPDPSSRFTSARELQKQLEPFVDQTRDIRVSPRDLYRRVEQLISTGRLDEAEALCLPEWKRLAALISRKRQVNEPWDAVEFHGVQIQPAGESSGRVHRLDNSGPVAARFWSYHVTGKPGLMLDVRIAEDDAGERQISSVNAYDSATRFIELVNRQRVGIRNNGDAWEMRLRCTTRPSEGRVGNRRATLEELSLDAGIDVKETLRAEGAIDVGRREDLGLLEPYRTRNEIAVLIPHDAVNEVALRAYLLTIVIPIARDLDLLLQAS